MQGAQSCAFWQAPYQCWGIGRQIECIPRHHPFVGALLYLPGSRQQGAAIRLPLTRGYYGAIDSKGLLVIIEHNPPTHLVDMIPRPRANRVTRLARQARASSPSSTRARVRGRHAAAHSCSQGSRRSSPLGNTLSGPHHLPAQPPHTHTSTSPAPMAMPRPMP